MSHRAVFAIVLALTCTGPAAGPAAGAPLQAPLWRTTLVSRSSGVVDGKPGERSREINLGAIEMPGAPWLRVVFGKCDLGDSSRILVRSSWNKDFQTLDARALGNWDNVSAVFNGDRVEVKLVVSPHDRGVQATVRAAVVGVGEPLLPFSQCGPVDDRVPSSDNRVARLFNMGCTAWRIGNGAFLTAGHCADLDPDGFGSMLPDGILDLNGVVEFNVPASLANGTMVAASPVDQYPVDRNGVRWRYDGEGRGLGKDWCVFHVNANANTGLLPHEAYGIPFRITRELPGDGAPLRMTGFGGDVGTANQTNQTSTGPFRGESSSGPDIRLDYEVDSQGGNSGGPVIWEGTDVCIGIHTTGGCTGSGGSNSGTSFEVDALESAINEALGANVTHVDYGHVLPMIEAGTLMRPYNTLLEGLNATTTGAVLSVFAGDYTVPAGTTITRSMLIQASVGPVLITGP